MDECIDDVDVLIDEALAQFAADPNALHVLAIAEIKATRQLRHAALRVERERESPDPARIETLQGEHAAATLVERARLYQLLGRLDRSALCLSGGGIRSAAFALGLLQSLAGHPRGLDDRPSSADRSMLGQMHFLSTVSGGGYIGGWLSAWTQRLGFPAVQAGLVGRVAPDIEPMPLSHLRRYSNYLTPKLGIMSADSWTAIALYFRNLFLNWLILVPAICLPLILLKIFAVVAAFFARRPTEPMIIEVHIVLSWLALALAIIAMIYALTVATRNRPIYTEHSVNQTAFLWHILVPVILSSAGWAGFFMSPLFSHLLKHAGITPELIAQEGSLYAKVVVIGGAAVIGALLYGIGWLIAQPWKRLRFAMRRPMSDRRQLAVDLFQFAFGGLVYGALIGAGIYLLLLLPALTVSPAAADCLDKINLGTGVDLQIETSVLCTSADVVTAISTKTAWSLQLYFLVALALPWLLFAQLTGEAVFTGLSSYRKNSDSDREWLGRAAGWYLLTSLCWLVIVILVYGGSVLLISAADLDACCSLQGWVGKVTGIVQKIGDYLAPIGGISGIATALLGGSSLTGDKDKARSDDSPIARFIAGKALEISALIFVIALVVFLSLALDQLLLGQSIYTSQLLQMKIEDDSAAVHDTFWLLGGVVAALLTTAVASHFININRFSLHALYRNRLIREFLGASHSDRHPNAFTGFCVKDNLPMYRLRRAVIDGDRPTRLLHIVNMTLNLVATENLAWQERKGESFTVSGWHSGAAALGYRPSDTYGKGEGDGISLGTAMAISGAAVSPNMGYHSSPLIAFLLTLLNVRLGWWLGNPRGKYAEEEGPTTAINWFLSEAFGLTKDDKDFIYLSDGGHFENLGLYEMVRRRCRHVIISDAGCDPDCALEDLGNAVRKIEIDLGVRVSFRDLDTLRPRLSVEDAQAGKHLDEKCWVTGKIHYSEAEPGAQDGRILYIKPNFRGTESAGVRAYALAHDDFPHESTSDQWFGEAQFESYRKLGLEIADDMLRTTIPSGTTPTISAFFAAL